MLSIGGQAIADVATSGDSDDLTEGTSNLMMTATEREALQSVLVESGMPYAQSFEDGVGNIAGYVDALGKLFFKAAEFETLEVSEFTLDPNEAGIAAVVEDAVGNYAAILYEDGRVITGTGGVTVSKAGGTTVQYAGEIQFSGNAVTVTETADGAEVAISGGGGAGAALGKTASAYGGVAKITEASLWGDRTLALQASLSTSAGYSGTETVFYPCVIRTDRISGAIDDYYMYYSTDHDSGSGGIYLATAPDPLGPWTYYGLVYRDPVGTQTETPSVVWDRYVGEFKLFYHCPTARYGAGNALTAHGAQSTLCATSSDGINWTKDPYFVIDFDPVQYGDGHTGYFMVDETPDGYIARSVYGGTTASQHVLWRCAGPLGGQIINGVICNNWVSDRRPLQYGADVVGRSAYAGKATAPLAIQGFDVGGVRYGVGKIFTKTSSTNTQNSIIVAGPISADYKRWTDMPVVIWEKSETWEDTDLRVVRAFVDDGFVYLYYNFAFGGATRCNRIGVMRHAL